MAENEKQKAKIVSLYAELAAPEQIEEVVFGFIWELFNDSVTYSMVKGFGRDANNPCVVRIDVLAREDEILNPTLVAWLANKLRAQRITRDFQQLFPLNGA